MLTTQDRRAMYNLAAFEVVVALRDDATGRWVVTAQDRDSQRGGVSAAAIGLLVIPVPLHPAFAQPEADEPRKR